MPPQSGATSGSAAVSAVGWRDHSRTAANHGPYFIQIPKPLRCFMSELSALAQIMTSAVALMGALVAGLSVYFTYRGRHNQFRQVVYGRQMDAYFDISESMSNLYTAAQNILATSNPWVKAEDASTRFRSALLEEHER